MGTAQWIWLAVAGLGLVSVLYFNRQLKTFLKLVRNGILGALGIWAGNFLLGFAGIGGFYVGINFLTVLVVGVLGLPGYIMLYLTQWIIG